MIVRPEGNQFRVEFEDLSRASPLKGLEEIDLGFHTLGLLTECKNVYDPQKKSLHSVTLNVNAIMDLSNPHISKYPQLKKALETVEISESDWSHGSWQFDGHFREEKYIMWWILSRDSGRQWRNKTFNFPVSRSRSPDALLDSLREEIAMIIPLERLSGVDEKLESLRNLMIDRGWFLQPSSEDDEPDEGSDDWIEEDGKESEETVGESDEVARIGSMTEMGQVYSYKGLDLTGTGGHKKIVVSLESDMGDCAEVTVVHDVLKHLNDSQYASGINSEHVDTEVNGNLVPYGIEEEELKMIKEKVKQVLRKEGIRFREE